MKPNPLEAIIASAARGGWDFFGNVDDEVRRRMDVDQSKAGQDAQAIARAWAHFYETPEGRKALEVLFDTTLRRTVYMVNLGQDAMSMATWGAFREGQNSLAQEIARQIARGLNEELKPRDS